MSCNKEYLNDFTVTNAPTARTMLPNVPTDPKYRVITVFNESNQDIRIDYKTGEGDTASFIVPKSGRAFTRVVNTILGVLYNSIYLAAIGSNAVGNVYINLGN